MPGATWPTQAHRGSNANAHHEEVDASPAAAAPGSRAECPGCTLVGSTFIPLSSQSSCNMQSTACNWMRRAMASHVLDLVLDAPVPVAPDALASRGAAARRHCSRTRRRRRRTCSPSAARTPLRHPAARGAHKRGLFTKGSFCTTPHVCGCNPNPGERTLFGSSLLQFRSTTTMRVALCARCVVNADRLDTPPGRSNQHPGPRPEEQPNRQLQRRRTG